MVATGRVSPEVAARRLVDASIGLAPYPRAETLVAGGSPADPNGRQVGAGGGDDSGHVDTTALDPWTESNAFWEQLAKARRSGGRKQEALVAYERALELAIQYAKQRRQFGQPIANFQAIQWKLAEMATDIFAARSMIRHAAGLKDQGQPATMHASMAKLFASQTAVKHTSAAVQIHGGYGYIKDYRAEKFYRDCKICTIGEGTSEIQRLVIARQLLKGF